MSERFAAGSGVLPFLTVAGAEAAGRFYAAAFGAVERERMAANDGKRLTYLRMEVNGGVLILADDFPELADGAATPAERSPVVLHMQVTDCQAAFDRALAAGAEPVIPPADMAWGDRYARLRDPFGHLWSLGETLAS